MLDAPMKHAVQTINIDTLPEIIKPAPKLRVIASLNKAMGPSRKTRNNPCKDLHRACKSLMEIGRG